VDHLIYGWVFFGIVMLLLFWVGSFWQENTATPQSSAHTAALEPRTSLPLRTWVLALVTVLIAAGLWPALSAAFGARNTEFALQTIEAPVPEGGWTLSASPGWDWQPVSTGADQELLQFYARDGQYVAVYLYTYVGQEQGAEAISGGNRYVDGHSKVRVFATGSTELEIDGNRVHADTVQLLVGRRSLEAWSMYRIGGEYTASRFYGKWLQLLQELGILKDQSTWLVLATESGDGSSASAVLGEFWRTHRIAIEASLDDAVEFSVP
jgi:EpsI family protein